MGKLKGSTRTLWTEGCIVLALLGLVLNLFALMGTEWGAWSSPEPLPGVDECLSLSGELDENPYQLPQRAKSVGLWHACVDGNVQHKNVQCCYSLPQEFETWHTICGMLYTLGVVVTSAALLLLTVFQCCADYRENRKLLYSFIGTQILGGIFLVTAIVIFGQNIQTAYDYEPGTFTTSWTYVVAATATGFVFLTAVIAGVQICRFPNVHGEARRLREEPGTSERPRHNGDTFDVQMEAPPAVLSIHQPPSDS